MATGYLRHPHVHADLVTFTAADDVWLAPVAGGRAWRVSHDGVPVLTPRFSPDGSHLAWVAVRDGQAEVMLQELASGRTRRLTHWGAQQTRVLGWTADGRVLAATNAGATDPRLTWVRAIDLDGSHETLPYGVAGGVAVHPSGAVAVCTGGRTPAWWKRYRGGTAARLWFDAEGHGEWSRLLPREEASLVDPMWVGDTLVFTSDREASLAENPDGQANLWAIDPFAARPRARRITEQGPDLGYVRDATTDGERIVWHTRGSLYLLDNLRATPRRIEVDLPGVDVAPITVDPHDQLVSVLPDAAGNASVVSWRGSVVLLAHRDGPARVLHADPAVRAREPQFLGGAEASNAEADNAVWVANQDGVDTVVVARLRDGRPGTAPRTLASGIGRVLHLKADPTGARVATISHDGWVRVIDVATGRIRDLARSEYGEARGPAFSPDGRHLVWHQPTRVESHDQLMVADLAGTAAAAPLTSGRFHDTAPVFTADGAHLVFLSARTFDPIYDQHAFGLSFAAATRPWLVPLSAAEPAPFGPKVDGRRDEPAPDQSAAAERSAPPKSTTLDRDGFEERAVPFPVPSGDFRDLQATRDGLVWIREDPDHGALGTVRAGVTGEAPGDVLEAWSLTRQRVDTLLDKVDSVRVSGDGTRLVCRVGDEITVRPADRKLDADDPALVTVGTDRLRRTLDRRAEWRQMFAENAQIMADHYWRPDLDGVDWAAAVARYTPLLERIVTHDDLVDVMWECVAELNTSHAYVQPAPPPDPQVQRRLGLLGADLSRARTGWRIDRVLPGESSDPAARSPLRAPGVDARVGDLVVAVDGQPVDLQDGPYPLLVGAADKPVELTLRRRGRDRRVVVVPLGDESPLRYQDWVRGRAEHVVRTSKGRLGYVHIPDMMSPGWAQLHRDLALAAEHEGLVVDVRYNRGGHTSQLVIGRLARRIVGWNTARNSAGSSYPSPAPRGPVVLVANEWSGSDGDIVNAAAQALDLGPVVGVRTWGGVVGIDGRFELVDGTRTTQPRYAYWFENYGWDVENHGVDPDIEVQHTPADLHNGSDPQLDRAVAEALALLAEHPAATPPPLSEPRVRS